MHTFKRVLAFVVSAMLVTFVGIAIWNRLSKRSQLVAKALDGR